MPDAPVHLAVHDIGGPVGPMWAMRNPERVASLLILNTTLFHEVFRPRGPDRHALARLAKWSARSLFGSLFDRTAECGVRRMIGSWRSVFY